MEQAGSQDLVDMTKSSPSKQSRPQLKLPSLSLLYTPEQLQEFLPASYPPPSIHSLADWLNSFCRPEERLDIESFCRSFPSLTKQFIPVRIIGEGTFSTVYLAIDVRHYKSDNSDWIHASVQDLGDAVKLWMLVELIEKVPKDGRRREVFKSVGVTALVSWLREHVLMDWLERAVAIVKHNKENGASNGADDWEVSEVELAQAMIDYPPHFVAIKRINSTSSPSRILDELSYLRVLGGKSNVVPVITGSRYEDQVLVVFPYFHHADFRDILPEMTVHEMACYLRLLFEALAWIHQQGIIHRDVKPSNFLFAPGSETAPCRAVLVDFGLAQVQPHNPVHLFRGKQRQGSETGGQSPG